MDVHGISENVSFLSIDSTDVERLTARKYMEKCGFIGYDADNYFF